MNRCTRVANAPVMIVPRGGAKAVADTRYNSALEAVTSWRRTPNEKKSDSRVMGRRRRNAANNNNNNGGGKLKKSSDHSSSSKSSSMMSTPASSPSSSPQLKKSVRFSSRINVRQFTRPLSQKDRAAMWYTDAEQDGIDSAKKLLLFKMDNGTKIDGDTTRGLESQTKEGKWVTYKNTRDAWNVVLDEQDRQRRQKIDDKEAMAKLYFHVTFQCRSEALSRGLKDARKARKYLLETFAKE